MSPFPFISTDIFSADVCGPDKELDVESCQCVCQRGLQTKDCGSNRHLDLNTCQCVCNILPAPSCPLNHIFNKENCQCMCSKTCPRHQPLNKTKCSCECNESPNKCFLKGRRFHQATCRWGAMWGGSDPPTCIQLKPTKTQLFSPPSSILNILFSISTDQIQQLGQLPWT